MKKTSEKMSMTSISRSTEINPYPLDLNKLHTPRQPEGCENPAPRGAGSGGAAGAAAPPGAAHPPTPRRRSRTDTRSRSHPHLPARLPPMTQHHEVKNAAQQPTPPPGSLDPLHCTGLRFDEQGMVFAHSILGSLKDFRCYLEDKGETELVRRICESPRDPPLAPTEKYSSEENGCGIQSGSRNIQRSALQHWSTHMRQRRRQQRILSDLLDRPVEHLLMNQANHFRMIQEQREFLSRAMPLIHSGYGNRVGSEFWSLPQRYGDEMSGITATLTQSEQGRQEPVTHVVQPSSIHQESGLICAETLRPASRTWDQSSYLQHQFKELREALVDMDFNKPDMDGLEIVGSAKPLTVVAEGPIVEKQEEAVDQEDGKKGNLEYSDLQSGTQLIPALRFCGQLAVWTGNSPTNQEQVGISSTILFEALTGERASSHLELHNEGSTVIFYSWQQLLMPSNFPNLKSQTKKPCFYFNSSSDVIPPGDSKRMELIFKSEQPGIRSEIWQLNTHPLLLQGASIQVTLRGYALYHDKLADQRHFIERTLDKAVTEKFCRSIVCELVQGVCTPERPSSPTELYMTEEQKFSSKNPKFQYHQQPVEDLKRQWEEVNPGCCWDLSVVSLRQAVLTLSESRSAQEKHLAQLNSLLRQLSEPSPQKRHITARTVGLQLWRNLFDRMETEAELLRSQLDYLGFEEKSKSLASDADLVGTNDEKTKKKAGAVKEERKVESRRKGRKKDEADKLSREKQGKEPTSPTDTNPEEQTPGDQNIERDVKEIYTRLLHKKVYALMEELVDNLCDTMDELNGGDAQD